MASCFPELLLVFLYFQHIVINAQHEEQFYFDDFSSQSDWIIENDGKGTVSTQWEDTSDDGRCNFLGGPLCLYLPGEGLVSRVIPSVGYHTLKIYIDCRANGNENNEYCYLQYRSSLVSWINDNLLTGTDVQLDIEIIIPTTDDYNDQSSFEVRLGHSGNAGGDGCFFDNLRLFGVPYTNNPTTDPTAAPIDAPTASPTSFPTHSITMIPTQAPTSNPTYDPTDDPTDDPTVDPTNGSIDDPTRLDQTIDPTHDPSIAPTVEPTTYPIATLSTTKSTDNPSRSPTKKPILINKKVDSLSTTVYIVSSTAASMANGEGIQWFLWNKDVIISVLLICILYCAICMCIGCLWNRKQRRNHFKTEQINISIQPIEPMLQMIEPNRNMSIHQTAKNDKDKVKRWLRDVVQLEVYYHCFIDNGFETMMAIKEIDEADLEQMGIVSKGDRVMLFREICKLKENKDKDISDVAILQISGEVSDYIDVDHAVRSGDEDHLIDDGILYDVNNITTAGYTEDESSSSNDMTTNDMTTMT